MANHTQFSSEDSDTSDHISAQTTPVSTRKRKIKGVIDPFDSLTYSHPYENWREDASCKNHPHFTLDDFFDVTFTRKNASKTSALQRLCQSCPVSAECLYEAMMFNYEGFWAGTSRKQRIAYLRSSRDNTVADLTVDECHQILQTFNPPTIQATTASCTTVQKA